MVRAPRGRCSCTVSPGPDVQARVKLMKQRSAPGPKESPERRKVTRGLSNGSRVEILDGLAVRDEILIENPAARAASKEK